MNFVKNVKIGTRLWLAFGFAAVVMLLLVVIAKLGLAQIGSGIDLINKDRYLKIRMAAQINDNVNIQARKLRNVLLFENATERSAELDAVVALSKDINAVYARLGPMLATDSGKTLFTALQAARADYLKQAERFDAGARAGDMAAARAVLLGDLRRQQLDYMKSIAEFVAFQERLMEDAGAAAAATVDRVSTWLIVAALVGVLLSALSAWGVTRSVTRPLRQAMAALQELEAGNLSPQAVADRGDELGKMLTALGRTTESLRRVVTQVRVGVESVTTASGEIAAGNHDLSSRTEAQASSLQETAASMEEFSGSVRQSADNARQASVLAEATSVAAARGGEVVEQVIGTMEGISASSRKIADIIGVIDGIAFQTNILALNAAVEAARAGEQGRGFAVVASEVRGLAQRSGEAAREIKALIGSSVDRVETGSRQVADAGSAMRDIVVQVRRVTGLISEISNAAVEQSSGIGQVSQAVTQMDRATQQNAALVEQAAAAAQSLSAQARQLADAVAVFRTE